MTLQIILASQSPRRRQLMQMIGYPFSAVNANVDESSITHADPAINAMLVAELKAKKIVSQLSPPFDNTIVIAADTIVTLDDKMLGKPKDDADAMRMLTALRSRTHEVHTGMVIMNMESGEMIQEVDTAVVTMRSYTVQETAEYISTGDPSDKAGAYAIQHPKFQPVANLTGCYLGVMGLSICRLLQILRRLQIYSNTNLALLHLAHQGYPCPIYDRLTIHK